MTQSADNAGYVKPPTPGYTEALTALVDLRKALGAIREHDPRFEPGTGPTAADNCARILEMMDFCVEQVGVYLGFR